MIFNHLIHIISQKQFLRHAAYAITYYLLGFFLTWLVYKLSGTPYPHGPNLFHLIGFLVLVGGLIWMIVCLADLSNKKGVSGALLVHSLVIGGIALSLVYELNREPDTSIEPIPEDIITIYKDSLRNEAAVINGAGDTILYMRNDSTIIDKMGIDSAKSNRK